MLTSFLLLFLSHSAGSAGELTGPPDGDSAEEGKWWKGNLHTHTLWSDGDSFPELIVDWYKENGYHFLALSDHNVLLEGQKWINPETYRFMRDRGEDVLGEYIDRFGERWVEIREVDDGVLEWLSTLGTEVEVLETGQRMRHRVAVPPEQLQPPLETGDRIVRLKPLNEFRHLFEEPGRFLLIPSEEISAPFVIHINATNLRDFVAPMEGEDVRDTIQIHFDEIYEQRERTGQAILPHLNHPNFRWAVTAEDMARVDGLRFFEVYNGHPAVANSGDEQRVDLDRFWDIVLTQRLAELDLDVVYGLAVDDAHIYHGDPEGRGARPGRGWVMVRAPFLTPEYLIEALEQGDFYATTGVKLHDFRSDGEALEVEIDSEPGVEYVTRFIGTREGYDPSSEPVLDEDGEEMENTTRRYGDDVGEVLAEVEGATSRYEFRGDEIYVRAKVVSSKPADDPYSENEEWEVAWVQPVLPGD